MADRLSEDQFAARLAEDLARPDELVSLVARSKPGKSVAKLVARAWGEPGARRVTLTRFLDARQIGQETFAATDLAARATELAREPFAHWDLATTTLELHARRAKRAILATTTRATVAREAPPTHDRKKNLLLDPEQPGTARVLAALGLASAKGHVLPGRERKLRQVERFVQLVLDETEVLTECRGGREAAAPETERRLDLLDAGCGAAYLTFALHHVLARELRVPVTVHGVDVRADVIEGARAVARELGVEEQVRFTQARIDDATVGRPHVVLSLHACDTATDEALAAGVRARAPLIFAVPCCQHELHKRVASDAFAPLLRHGILRERLADLATDALRAQLLRAHGYRTDVIEFVSADATAKNLLIRAVRTSAPPDPRWMDDLSRMKRALGLEEPVALERLLATTG